MGLWHIMHAIRPCVFYRADCEAQVKKYPGAVFKGFPDLEQARSFLEASPAARARTVYLQQSPQRQASQRQASQRQVTQRQTSQRQASRAYSGGANVIKLVFYVHVHVCYVL